MSATVVIVLIVTIIVITTKSINLHKYILEMGMEPNQYRTNRTRTHILGRTELELAWRKHIEFEPNRTHQCDEPEPSDQGSGWVRQICRLAGTFAVNAQHSSAILSNVGYHVLVGPFRNSIGNKMALTLFSTDL